jgi:branched-chain amino acid transport system permease protein
MTGLRYPTDTTEQPDQLEPVPVPGRRGLQSTLLRHLAVGVLAVVVVLLLSTELDPYRNLQLTNVAYLVCAAAGLSVLTGLSGQISLGQGALMAVGAYTTALLLEAGWPLIPVLLIAVLLTSLVGVLVGAAAARLRGPYLAGATLAFAIGLPALADYRGLAATLGGQNGLVVLSPPPPEWLSGLAFDRWQLAVSTIAAAIALVLLGNLVHSRFGRSWRAVRDDEVAAELAGLPVARLQIIAFVVSAACAGLGGALLAFVNGLAAPGAFPLTLSLQLLAAVVLGGLGTIPGAIYGSFLLVFLPTWSASLATELNLSRDVYANLPLAVYGAVLVLVMLAFPSGVQGALRRIAHRVRRNR